MQSLNIKYRPTTFEDVCGQSVTVKILDKVVKSGNFKNVYLFAGDSGCGKTTLARIFANLINQGEGEPIEIDAASNNGVNDVREIIEQSTMRSITGGVYKIFIIDECHAITAAGWQAFLKGIEEPPAYTIFMFCTTEPNKIPATILNRVQRYNITKISTEEIYNRLVNICKNEGFTNFEQTCELISKSCSGCMRDAITLLDQCADYSTDLSANIVESLLSGVSYREMCRLTWALTGVNAEQSSEDRMKEIFSVVEYLYNNGHDLRHFVDEYLRFVLDLTKYAVFKNISLTSIPSYLNTKENPVIDYTIGFSDAKNGLEKMISDLLALKATIKFDTSYKETVEAYLLKMMRGDK